MHKYIIHIITFKSGFIIVKFFTFFGSLKNSIEPIVK